MEILCLCHLAMDRTLFQRPQQLMRQFARRGHHVQFIACLGWKKALKLWIEGQGRGHFEALSFSTAPYSPYGGGFSRMSGFVLRRMLSQRFSRARVGIKEVREKRVLWIYHPNFARFVDAWPADVVIYDVMDRFPCFSRSTKDVRTWEREAYQCAHLIFAGGHSLAAAVVADLAEFSLSRPVHCFPSAVDLPHFAQALNDELAVPADVASLSRPILGYFGAVDERIDFDLLRVAAESRTDWNFVLVGPVLTSSQNLPGNVHLLGARAYSELPNYLKAFDVCLLPFRQSDLVAHVSPTKTPEYLAGGRPVVSTPIPDVMRDYGDQIPIVKSAPELVSAVERLLVAKTSPLIWHKLAAERSRTWEQLAEEMEALIKELGAKAS